MVIDHKLRARQAWPLLAARARGKLSPYTYGELCAQLGLHPRAAQYFLGVIQTHCKLNRLPPLQSLAVNKRTRLPGIGYSGSKRSRAAHTAAVQSVWSAKWSPTAPRRFDD
jgi:hypothetical protein